jgi:hypothetical protein
MLYGITETAGAPGSEPDAADRVAQDESLEATHVNVPPPVLLIERLCDTGTALPIVNWYGSDCGVTDRTAGAAVTTRVTATVTGLLDAAVDAI